MNKNIDTGIIEILLKKGETGILKGFEKDGKKVNGKLKLDVNFNLVML